MLKINHIKKTCDACPTQWEGTLEDGRMIYVRYRWGCLEISLSAKPTTDIFEAVSGGYIFDERVGKSSWDGEMTYEQLKAHTGHILEFPEKEREIDNVKKT